VPPPYVLSNVWAKEKEPVPTPSSSRASALPLLEWYIHFTCIIPRLFCAPYIMSRGLASSSSHLTYIHGILPHRQVEYKRHEMHNVLNFSAPASPGAKAANEKFGLQAYIQWLMTTSQFRLECDRNPLVRSRSSICCFFAGSLALWKGALEYETWVADLLHLFWSQ
jgi:hypothetical protein